MIFFLFSFNFSWFIYFLMWRLLFMPKPGGL